MEGRRFLTGLGCRDLLDPKVVGRRGIRGCLMGRRRILRPLSWWTLFDGCE
jgi:hypothetical protein